MIVQLQEFAASVARDGFESTANHLVEPGVPAKSSFELSAALAASLVRDVGATDADVMKKSLQEMFFYATEVQPEITRPEFGSRLQTFLKRTGGKGWIGLFLNLHLANVIRLNLDRKSLTSNFSGTLEESCQAAVRASIASLAKWPALNRKSASALVESVKSRIESAPRTGWRVSRKASQA